MTTSSKVIVTSLLVLAVAGVAAADAMVKEKSLTGQLSLWLGGEESSDTSSSVATVQTGSSASSVAGEVPMQGVNDAVLATLVEKNFTYDKKEEPSIVRQLLPSEPMESYALLQNGDRAGSISWVSPGNVTQAYQALKESLLQSFSSELRDLKDETVSVPGQPTYSMLTFFDPKLSQERLAFVKTATSLFEMHITAGKEEAMQSLVAPVVSKL